MNEGDFKKESILPAFIEKVSPLRDMAKLEERRDLRFHLCSPAASRINMTVLVVDREFEALS